ncbi:MAG: hypothetical protein IAE94_10835, partial [Chthoniobacterales bacterium]|nr:hypothetical protein [Chthoniobacterales bacterium]
MKVHMLASVLILEERRKNPTNLGVNREAILSFFDLGENPFRRSRRDTSVGNLLVNEHCKIFGISRAHMLELMTLYEGCNDIGLTISRPGEVIVSFRRFFLNVGAGELNGDCSETPSEDQDRDAEGAVLYFHFHFWWSWLYCNPLLVA